MGNLSKRYIPIESERTWRKNWEEKQVYRFQSASRSPVYSIDTPPPTVSGDLHMGHCYSYCQADFYARFHRMKGCNVFYPMGWDDNGLPTERLVEKRLGIRPENVGPEVFILEILKTSQELEHKYKNLWQRLGLSVDWNHTYSTISPESRKIAQYSFIDLFRKGLVYQASSPTIWCPVCRTAIAQAEVSDMQRSSQFVTVTFKLDDGQPLLIATTRPELLPACVAIFVNPLDERHRHLIGHKAITPVFGKEVPILADKKADPEKGTGIVMCCTFGDATDVKWQRERHLPIVAAIDTDGRLGNQAGALVGLNVSEARQEVIKLLADKGLITDISPTIQTVSVHERCDTPIEYITTEQWFVRVLDQKQRLLDAGRAINWYPSYMLARYEDWVQNLEWDWCISRQRYHGVPFPLWYCASCGSVTLADSGDLPVDPRIQPPPAPCKCGRRKWIPEESVMDTWATSSLTPQIAGRWLEPDGLFNQVFPMSLRPQAHDIIRTWTFYTIVKSIYHLDTVPWKDVAVSGHGLSPEGNKVSKSKDNSVVDPLRVLDKYSADAVRYWAASAKLGENALISEERIAAGQKLVNKLWSVSVFSYQFLNGYRIPASSPELVPTDKWVLSQLQRLIVETTQSFADYDHAAAKTKVEAFFWDILADNYLEMVKARLYDEAQGLSGKQSAQYALYKVLSALNKMFAPFLPYITEEIFQSLFTGAASRASIHTEAWPTENKELIDESAERLGEAMVEIAVNVRRYKSQQHLAMGARLDRVTISTEEADLIEQLKSCLADIRSVTRAETVELRLDTARCSESHGKVDVAVGLH
ncbi:MAG: valine--tRNA ligase [Chloroflexi bacterium]|nr:valine--tRNA ligase [Chloroflexota bacterium]